MRQAPTLSAADIAALIRPVPDYPQPGVIYRDLTPLLADGAAFQAVTAHLVALARDFDVIAGIEARGFLFGAALAQAMGSGIVLIRKGGKLPRQVIAHDYALEYGQDRLEMHADAVRPGDRVLLVDDVLATGGTASAAVALLRKAGATVERALFVVGLPALDGRSRLAADSVAADWLVQY